MAPLTLAEVNALDRDAFVARLGSLFEGPPWIVEAAWSARPFASRDDLHRGLCNAMQAAPVEQQVALLQAHPDLAGRAALAGALSAESTREQAAAGLGTLAPGEIAVFDDRNRAYRRRFGFPFVLCAREHTRASILASLAERLDNARDAEIRIALGEVAKICRLRLLDLVAEDGGAARTRA
jgi:2-oxo-4-hydroxy-4-carboxy-5-ureidoimidazoline decarboxylase